MEFQEYCVLYRHICCSHETQTYFNLVDVKHTCSCKQTINIYVCPPPRCTPDVHPDVSLDVHLSMYAWMCTSMYA